MQTSVLHGSILGKSSEKVGDMTLGCARVPKTIPMQGYGGLRGPFLSLRQLVESWRCPQALSPKASHSMLRPQLVPLR